MNDEYEGQGGSYIINDSGARELVSRTRESGDEPAVPPEPPVLTEAITPPKPAKVGFFTPVAPAESTHETE